MATIKPISVPTKRLASSIDASASAFQLSDIKGWDGEDLVAGDFGSVAYGVFRDENNTVIELFEFDPSTIANASITINIRGLKYDGDLTTEVTANKLTWVKNVTMVEIGSNPPQLLNHNVRTVGDQTIADVKTFTSPVGVPTGVANGDAVNLAQMNLAVLGTLTTINVIVPGKAGETVAAGEGIYFDTTDDEWKLWDADTAATVENVQLGIAQGAGTDGVAIDGGVLLQGVDTNQSGLVEGDSQYAGNTAGAISNTPGTNEVTVGIAKSATELYFVPRFDQQLTEDQQDALAGNLGTPASGDKFVTQTGLQKGAEIYAADAEANDTYVITLSPVPTAYFTGMILHFKANTANTGAATLNVNTLGAKTIKKLHDQDLGTGDIESGQIITVVYDGTNFQMQSQVAISTLADVQTFASSGTWTKPAGATKVLVQAWGAGGSGGKGNSTNAGGGGGGLYFEAWFDASDLGATETVTIGTGGAAKSSAGSGNGGGDTTFGSLLTADGGSGGGSAAAADTSGGSGGARYAAVNGLWGAGVSAAVGQSGIYSAAGGGTNNGANSDFDGGDSEWGGAGGGGSNQNGGAAASGGTSVNGGNGGAGNINGDATAGTVPAGGGGANSGTGNSGAGADGQMIVTTFA